MLKHAQRNSGAEEHGQIKPWEDESGRELSMEQLREVSRNWSAETWEEYLQNLEVYPEHFLVDNYEDALRTYGKEDSTKEESVPFTDLTQIENGMKKLHPMEQTVIRAMFWDRKSEREISDLLGISRRAVMKLKKDGLRRLKVQFLSPDGERNNVHALQTSRRDRAFGSYPPQMPLQLAIHQELSQ